MKKMIALASMTLLTQATFAADLSTLSSLVCTGKTGQVTATYSKATQILVVNKAGQAKAYEMVKLSGGGDLDLVANGTSEKNGNVQLNLASSGTAMIYQVTSGEVDYLTCQGQ